MRQTLLALFLLLLVTGYVAAQDEPTPYDIALQHIEETRITGANELDLRNLGLTDLPSEIGQLTYLQTLWLSDNQLISLLPQIGQLTNLQYLYLSRNLLSSLPSE